MDVGRKADDYEDQEFVDNILSLKSKCVLAINLTKILKIIEKI